MSNLIDIDELKLFFPLGRRGLFKKPGRFLKAVDGVTLGIKRGETLGLVGESGSGKTTFGRAVISLIKPTGGRVRFHSRDKTVEVTALNRKALRLQWRHMQMIFQDPYASLNPRMTVKEIIGESLVANHLASGRELDARVREMATLCGLSVNQLSRYPHAFSGGQRQRIAIARALVMHPEFIVCDEPVSALDVSIQAQVLNLLKDLQKKLDLTYLFIAHDLSAVAYACDRVAVMYLGRLVEVAETENIYYSPRHPYTEALMSAIPPDNPELAMAPVLLEGEQPNPASPPPGCTFHPRCRFADQELCRNEPPQLRKFAEGHLVACHRAGQISLNGALEHSTAGSRNGSDHRRRLTEMAELRRKIVVNHQ